MRPLLLWLMLVVTPLFGAQENELYLFTGKFKNQTTHDYIIYLRDRALEGKGGQILIAQTALWQPALFLKAGEEGTIEVMLHDPDQFGSQLKLVPQTKDSAYPTIYIKGFVKTSGNCGENWWTGPSSLLISADEELFNNPLKGLDQAGIFRYCGFRKSYMSFVITPDGITAVNEHNAHLLEPSHILFSSLKQEERDEKH